MKVVIDVFGAWHVEAMSQAIALIMKPRKCGIFSAFLYSVIRSDGLSS